jgi:hypothetical protein
MVFVADLDGSKPSIARVYDFRLGGKTISLLTGISAGA